MKKEKIQKKRALIFFLIMGLFLFSIMQVSAQNNLQNEKEIIVIDFFWMNGCGACGQMKLFLEELEINYNIQINSYETSKNSNLFSENLKEYNVPSERRGYVPTVFIEDNYFVGYSSEITRTIELIVQGEDIGNSGNLVGETVKTKVLGLWNVEVSLSEKSVLGAGFILALLDSINVCSITVLIFLIIFSLSIGSVKRAFKIGLVFTFVIFVFYILFMLVLTSVLGMFVNNYGVYIRLGVVVISLFSGLILIKDFFWYGKGISLSIPSSAKPLLEKYIKQATIGSTIVLGVLASLVELPCTAIFPLIYTTVLAESGVFGFQKIAYILFYNLIYIWPLLFVVFGTYSSWVKIENIDEKIQKSKKWMRLIAGTALLLIALYFIWPLIIR